VPSGRWWRRGAGVGGRRRTNCRSFYSASRIPRRDYPATDLVGPGSASEIVVQEVMLECNRDSWPRAYGRRASRACVDMLSDGLRTDGQDVANLSIRLAKSNEAEYVQFAPGDPETSTGRHRVSKRLDIDRQGLCDRFR